MAGSVVTSDFKQPEVAEVTLPGGQVIQRVTIPCQDRIDQGRAGIIYLKCYFENMVTPDQTVGSFNSILFTGTLTDGSGNTEKLVKELILSALPAWRTSSGTSRKPSLIQRQPERRSR